MVNAPFLFDDIPLLVGATPIIILKLFIMVKKINLREDIKNV